MGEMQATSDTPSTGRAVAFHATALVLGVPLLFAVVLAFFKLDPPELHRVTNSLERFFDHGDPLRIALFIVLTFGPPLYAFGTDLRFSLKRYVFASLFVAFWALQAFLRARGNPYNALVVPLGVSVLGFVLSLTLGNAGLLIHRLFVKASP
jgi:hypothetical protein